MTASDNAPSDSPDALTSRFLALVRDGQDAQANDILTANPSVGRASVHAAAAVGDVTALEWFIGADPACASRPSAPHGTPPIVFAVFTDLKRMLGVTDEVQAATVKLLLDAGADPNATVPLEDTTDAMPVLYFPCVANAAAVATLLLERGARPNDGESLYHAAQHNHREILALLVQHGAAVSGVHEPYANTPLYFLAAHTASNPITERAMLGMEWLLDHGADPNVPSTRSPSHAEVPGGTELPLHRAAANGHGEAVMRMLVEHGAVVDAPRGDGRTAYALAVRVGNRSAAEYLAHAGADTSKLTPVDRLLAACAAVDEPAARAIVTANPDILATLSAEDRQALMQAVSDDRLDVVRLMLTLGWPLDDESEWGGTALHWAAWNGRDAMARLLVEHGAPINQRDTRYGSSPIAWTAHGSRFSRSARDEQYVAIAKLLLAAGATRPESFNQWNEAPESMATPAVAQVLVESGFAGSSAH